MNGHGSTLLGLSYSYELAKIVESHQNKNQAAAEFLQQYV